jgi:hypothetical protein
MAHAQRLADHSRGGCIRLDMLALHVFPLIHKDSRLEVVASRTRQYIPSNSRNRTHERHHAAIKDSIAFGAGGPKSFALLGDVPRNSAQRLLEHTETTPSERQISGTHLLAESPMVRWGDLCTRHNERCRKSLAEVSMTTLSTLGAAHTNGFFIFFDCPWYTKALFFIGRTI